MTRSATTIDPNGQPAAPHVPTVAYSTDAPSTAPALAGLQAPSLAVGPGVAAPALGGGGAAAAPPHAADLAIEVRALGKCYEIYDRPHHRLLQSLHRGRRRFFREFWALRDIDLAIPRGEAFGVIGRNGSGKSTLLQIIAGTLRPTTGDVVVRGRVAALLELGSGFNHEFTGRENVFLNGAILGVARREIEARFDEIAAFADIGPFLELPVKTYSTGMVVRLAFAVQALLDPDVLIVDEALAVGDAAFQSRCFRRLNGLLDRGATVLFVSHDIMTVATTCRRALLLEHGRAAMLGAARDVTQEYYRRCQDAERRDASAAPPAAESNPAIGGDSLEPLGPHAGLRQGDGRAEVVGVAVFDDRGVRTRALRTRRPFRVELGVRFHEPLQNPQAGVALRDVRNQMLLGAHTMYDCAAIGPAAAGDEVRLTFDMTMHLNPGKYLLMFGVADHAAWSSWTEHDVVWDYCEIEVYGHERAWALVNAPARVDVRRVS